MNVLITGASKGIGKAIAEKFAENGHALLLTSRNADQLQQTVTALQIRFPDIPIKSFAADLVQKEEAIALGMWALREGDGAPEVLVNNAGIYFPGSVADEEDGNLEKIMAINLYSAYHLTRTLLPRMIAKKQGHIFNMCSIASIQAYPNGGAYSISKFALLGFSKNLREEMKPHGIKVTAILPGAVYTDSWKGSGIAPERIMEAADIANLLYTASRLSPQAVIEDIVIRPQLGDL